MYLHNIILSAVCFVLLKELDLLLWITQSKQLKHVCHKDFLCCKTYSHQIYKAKQKPKNTLVQRSAYDCLNLRIRFFFCKFLENKNVRQCKSWLQIFYKLPLCVRYNTKENSTASTHITASLLTCHWELLCFFFFFFYKDGCVQSVATLRPNDLKNISRLIYYWSCKLGVKKDVCI